MQHDAPKLIIVGEAAGIEDWILKDIKHTLKYSKTRLRLSSSDLNTPNCFHHERQLVVLIKPRHECIERCLKHLQGLQNLHIYFLGHGDEGGWMVTRADQPLHGSTLFSIMSKLEGGDRIHLHLNCCFADDIVASIYVAANQIALISGCFNVVSAFAGEPGSHDGPEPAKIEEMAKEAKHPVVRQLCELWLQAQQRANNFCTSSNLFLEICETSRYADITRLANKRASSSDVKGSANSVEAVYNMDKEAACSSTTEKVSEGACSSDSSKAKADGKIFQWGDSSKTMLQCESLGDDDNNLLTYLVRHIQNTTRSLQGNCRLNMNNSILFLYPAGFGPIPAIGMMQDSAELLEHPQLLTAQRAGYAFPNNTENVKELWLNRLTSTRPTITLFRQSCGDATLICLPNGTDTIHLLIDGGYSSPNRGPAVWWPAVDTVGTLDCLLVTHTDEDHIGGIKVLAEHYAKFDKNKFHIKNVVMTAIDYKETDKPVLLRSYQQWREVRNIFSKAGLLRGVAVCGLNHFWSDNVKLFIVAPSPQVHSAERERQMLDKPPSKTTKGLKWPNPASIVTLLLWRKDNTEPWTSMLFTGDAPGDGIVAGLKELQNMYDDVGSLWRDNRFHLTYMDLPHHGSSKNQPDVLFEAVIAENYGHSYDGKSHPTTMCDGVTIEALVKAHKTAQKGAMVLRTFEQFKAGNARANYNSEGNVDKVVGNVTMRPLGVDDSTGKPWPGWTLHL